MTEQELYKKIKSSAEEIEVPERLSPENMKNKLDEMVLEQKHHTGNISHWYAKRKWIAAAAVMMVCVLGVGTVYQFGRKSANGDMTDAASYELAAAKRDESEASGKKADAGKLYVIAKDYGAVYDILEEKNTYLYSDDMREYEDTMYETVESEESSVDSGTDAGMSTSYVLEDSAAEAAVSTEEDYSKTNLNTEGVDESDIIKTDGKYIYIVDEDVVKIIDIQNTKMKAAGEISISMRNASDEVVEMYVDGDMLNLIIEREDIKLQQGEKNNFTKQSSTTDSESNGENAVSDVYRIESARITQLLTYDISNRANPQLLGSISQDGYYKTSRKINQIVYLFTQEELKKPNLTREEAVTEANTGGWIPLVNGNVIDADSIYVPECGNEGLIISSVNVEQPDTIVDNTLIMNDFVNIYVSMEAIYLYGGDYSASGVKTQIAKFSLKDGVIDAVGAASAAGEVYDTFAINEYKGKLRLLTTDRSGAVDENQLYLFDEQLNVTGSLKEIAQGEEIYSARYLGDIVYFVTYRNTDPLFAVDLSDEKNPKILSEVKITGFSEYLHVWGKDKLLGIGYETDPDSGEKLGLKITMFDISNPTKLQVAGSCVIEDMDYSPALYNYKCVLADAEENLIGFAAESYGEGQKQQYLLFAWEDGRWKELLTEDIRSDSYIEEYRGLYSGDTFYLVNKDRIFSYDRGNAYKKLDTFKM